MTVAAPSGAAGLVPRWLERPAATGGPPGTNPTQPPATGTTTGPSKGPANASSTTATPVATPIAPVEAGPPAGASPLVVVLLLVVVVVVVLGAVVTGWTLWRRRHAGGAESARTHPAGTHRGDWSAVRDAVRSHDLAASSQERAAAAARLQRLGVQRVGVDPGDAMDPARHNVVGVVVRTDIPPGRVVEVVRPGWLDGAEMVRPADVVVSVAPQT